PLNRSTGNLCVNLPGAWACSDDAYDEVTYLVKPGPSDGGALCCRDGVEEAMEPYLGPLGFARRSPWSRIAGPDSFLGVSTRWSRLEVRWVGALLLLATG